MKFTFVCVFIINNKICHRVLYFSGYNTLKIMQLFKSLLFIKKG